MSQAQTFLRPLNHRAQIFGFFCSPANPLLLIEALALHTYLHKDLPPSPICIPGIESLVGTAKPLKSNYLYFVSKNMKNEGHLFSENYKDHLENIKLIKERNTINE